MISTKQPRVYIAAPASADTSVLRRIIEAERAVPDDAFSIDAGEDVVSAVLTRIRKADLVIALFGEGAWTAYEVGVADALRKPVLLIVRGEQRLPDQLARRVGLRTTVTDTEVLRLTLRKLLEDVRKNPKRLITHRSKRTSRRPATGEAPRLAARIRSARADPAPLVVEELAQDLLRSVSATVAAQPRAERDKGVDFAVLDDDLSASVGGTLLVEVKAGNLSQDRLKTAEAHLLRALHEAGARLGLLLYLDAEGRRFPQRAWEIPNVLRFDLEDLAVALLDRPLASIVLEHRNRLAHGIS